MAITPTALHDALTQAAEGLRSQRIEGLFDTTPDRTSGYRCEAAGLTLDYSKHLLDDDAWQTLSRLVDTYALPAAFASLIGGEIVNTSEHRPALHTLLRGTASDQHPEKSKEIETFTTDWTAGISTSRSARICNKIFLSSFDPHRPHRPLEKYPQNDLTKPPESASSAMQRL